MSIADLSKFVAEQRVTLGNVSRETYVDLCENAENPRGRLAYDEGALEITSPSYLHKNVSRLIGRMIKMFTFHNQIEIQSAKLTTFKLHKKLKGFEANESYYISHVTAMHGISEVELKIHPPPDLAVEVDISRSSHFKMRVFAGLGVGEVWRYEGDALTVHVLRDDKYELRSTSGELPEFAIALANELLAQRDKLKENELIASFVAGSGKNGGSYRLLLR